MCDDAEVYDVEGRFEGTLNDKFRSWGKYGFISPSPDSGFSGEIYFPRTSFGGGEWGALKVGTVVYFSLEPDPVRVVRAVGVSTSPP